MPVTIVALKLFNSQLQRAEREQIMTRKYKERVYRSYKQKRFSKFNLQQFNFDIICNNLKKNYSRDKYRFLYRMNYIEFKSNQLLHMFFQSNICDYLRKEILLLNSTNNELFEV